MAGQHYQFIKEKLNQVLFGFYKYRIPHGQVLCCHHHLNYQGDPENILGKLIQRYEPPLTHYAASRRRKKGEGIVLPMLWERHIFITADINAHDFIQERKGRGDLIDLRQEEIFVEHYSIGVWNGKACVRICGHHFTPRANNLLELWMIDITRLQFYFDKITPFTQIPSIAAQLEELRGRINKRRKKKKMPLLEPPSWERFKNKESLRRKS